jgi:hypothetical protein
MLLFCYYCYNILFQIFSTSAYLFPVEIVFRASSILQDKGVEGSDVV